MNVNSQLTPRGHGAPAAQYFDPGAMFVPDQRAARPIFAEGSALDPRRVLDILWRWRWLVLGSVALGIALATILTFLATPRYRATAIVEINQPESQVVSTDKRESVAIRDPQFLSTQLGLLKSASLAERVSISLGLASDEAFVAAGGAREQRVAAAAGKITGNLQAEPVNTSRLIRVSYSDTDPARAARIANGLVDNFIATNLERRYDATAAARQFLENRIRTVKVALEKSERDLVGYARNQGIVLVAGSETNSGDPSTSTLDSSSLVSINQSLAEAQNARIQAEQRYRQTQAAGSSTELVNNATVQGLISARATLEAEYQEKLNRFKPEYPEMVAMKSRIDSLNRQIGTSSGSISTSLRAEYQAAAARENALRARVNQLKSAMLDLRGRSVQYNILQRDLDTNRTLYDGLLQRYKEIGVAGGIGSSSASVVDRAKAPGAPYSPNLILNLFLAVIAALALALGLAFLLDYLDDTVKSADDVRTKLGQDPLGAIPKLEKGQVLYEMIEDPNTPISESYASVRAAVQFSTSEGAPSNMLITSTRPEEGKSSTAFAIAYQFTRLGKSVLLIDADMRKPTFRASGEDAPGLSSVLTGSDLRSSLLSTQVEGLHLLPSGPIPPNPAELLSSGRMERLIKEAEALFDHIVIDAPPLLGLADSQLLGSFCKATIFVVESGTTRRPAAVASLERLRSGGANVIGVILTKFKASAGYGYNYEYASYTYGSGDKKRQDARAIPLVTQRLK